jgi:hypothetical protein
MTDLALERVYEDELAVTRKEFPKFRLVEGAWFVFLSGITICNTVYVKRGWAYKNVRNRIALLRHERIHLRQYKRLGLGSNKLGLIPFLFLYLLVPLPIWRSWRALLEVEAYRESLAAWADLGEPNPEPRARMYAATIASRKYGWAWSEAGLLKRLLK